MKKFRNATPDVSAKIMTAGLIVLTIFFAVLSLVYKTWHTVPALAVFVVVLVVSFGFIPKIFIDDKQLTIKNLFSTIKIPLEEITQYLTQENASPGYRSSGIGGVFGYFGRFNGKEKWFVTNAKKIIKIKTATGKIYALSPEDTDDFISTVKVEGITNAKRF